MVNNINYQKKLEKILNEGTEGQTLLLHSCCAPCSSYVINYLADYFKITVFYYNPNITEQEEYCHRVCEQKRLISEMPATNKVDFIEGEYIPKKFFEAVKGLESAPEGGERCKICYGLRLDETAKLAAKKHFDYFATTLTISPLKSSYVLNQIGREKAEKYGVKWLPNDFKKKEGYKKSIELSKKFNLYRQNYCGCVFSKKVACK